MQVLEVIIKMLLEAGGKYFQAWRGVKTGRSRMLCEAYQNEASA